MAGVSECQVTKLSPQFAAKDQNVTRIGQKDMARERATPHHAREFRQRYATHPEHHSTLCFRIPEVLVGS